MKNYIIFLILLFFFAESLHAKKVNQDTFADSLMTQVFKRSESYGKYIVEYSAEAYIKGESNVLKKNILFRFAPDFFALDKKSDRTIIESLVDIHYLAPNNFTQKILAINGTSLNTDDIYQRAMQFLNINVYNPTSFNDEVLMPTSEKAFKYYRFYYDSATDTLNYRILKIKVEPKVKSQKLVSGYIYIVDKLWMVARIDLKGKWDFSEFKVQTDFGLPEKDFLMPLATNLYFKINVLGNEVENHYTSHYTYTFVKKYENAEEKERLSKNYDLSDHFNISLDTLPVVKDSLFWEKNRPIPLTESEKEVYRKYDVEGAQKQFSVDTLSLNNNRTWSFAKGIITPTRFAYNSTQFRYSGLLNPFKLAYSKSNGIVYWQKLKLIKITESGKALSFDPDIGFVFKRKEVFFNTPLSYLFNPLKMGQVGFSLGNRNQSYNSKIIDLINEATVDSINFDDFNLKYYRHYYLAITGQFELFNGFLGYAGLDYHLYQPVKSSEETPQLKQSASEDIVDLVDNNYKSFTPMIGLTCTPKQYYRINGKRKEYIGSKYPTFSLEYTRSLNGILDSNSDYERIEADVQQTFSLGLLRTLQYYAGAGIFTNTQSVYFVDFRKFARRNFPQSWDDQIGGVFQLLDSRWYNASDSYIQFHAMYEAPFVLLKFFRNVSKDIFKERFYYSQLYTPVLPSYTEFGYGVGSYLFNVGIFVSFNKGECDGYGFKFAFELGR